MFKILPHSNSKYSANIRPIDTYYIPNYLNFYEDFSELFRFEIADWVHFLLTIVPPYLHYRKNIKLYEQLFCFPWLPCWHNIDFDTYGVAAYKPCGVNSHLIGFPPTKCSFSNWHQILHYEDDSLTNGRSLPSNQNKVFVRCGKWRKFPSLTFIQPWFFLVSSNRRPLR